MRLGRKSPAFGGRGYIAKLRARPRYIERISRRFACNVVAGGGVTRVGVGVWLYGEVWIRAAAAGALRCAHAERERDFWGGLRVFERSG